MGDRKSRQPNICPGSLSHSAFMKSTSTLETLQEADKIFGDNFNLISAEEMMCFFVVVVFFLVPHVPRVEKI